MTRLLALARLIASTIDRTLKGKLILKLTYEKVLPNESRVYYYRYLSLPSAGTLNEITQDELKLMGFQGELSSLFNQGLHNRSLVLDFGKEYELELEEFNGRMTVNRVRKAGGTLNSTSLNISDVSRLLEDVTFSSLSEVKNDEQ